MTCPYLDYRASAGDHQFDVERAYCTAADRFVQPMRADVCNDRYGLDHAEHCEIFRAQEGEPGEDSESAPATDQQDERAAAPDADDEGER